MGCISSKFITKSLSFREDLNRRDRGANGLTILDELFTSDDGNGTNSSDHQFFALVSKLRTGDFVLPRKKSVESKNEEIINTWELMAGLEEQAEQTQDVIVPSPAQELASSKVITEPNIPSISRSEQGLGISSKVIDLGKLKRSKSCEMLMLATPFGIDDDEGYKGVGRSTSFHTVEEYDAMMERIMFSNVHNEEYDKYLDQPNQTYPVYPAQSRVREYDQYLDHHVAKFRETAQSIPRNVYENNKAYTTEPDIKEVIPNQSSRSIYKDVVQETRTRDTGLKRKALAKGLELLQIPSPAEFRKTGSLKDWLQNGGNSSSPGEYVTPKFGNYNKQKSGLSEDYTDDSIFNPELVAAFEEFLQQLEIEEDCILDQIEGNRNEIIATE